MDSENQAGDAGMKSGLGLESAPGGASGSAEWTFLSNYAHVLVCLARDPQVRMRDVAVRVGITERAVQRIVADLMDAGYLRCEKLGRRNRYHLDLNRPLRHPLEADCAVGELVSLFLPHQVRMESADGGSAASRMELKRADPGSTPASARD